MITGDSSGYGSWHARGWHSTGKHQMQIGTFGLFRGKAILAMMVCNISELSEEERNMILVSMRRFGLTVCTCGLLAVMLAASGGNLLLAQPSCSATPIVGGPVNNQGDKIHGTGRYAQSFIAPGTTGECLLLDRITIEVCKNGSPEGSLLLEIHDASGGIPAPTDTPLGTASIAPTDVTTGCGNGQTLPYQSVTATFPSPPSVTGGSLYAVLLRQAANSGSGSNNYQLGLVKAGPYASGQYCRWDGGSSTWACPESQGALDAPLALCTSQCTVCAGCTYTQGYWKNHETWPVAAGLTLGTVAYTNGQLSNILDTQPGGPGGANGLIQLAHQLIAAKLNQAKGACVPPSVSAAIAAADTLIGALVIPPIGGGYLAPSVTSSLTYTLDQYNSGCTAGGPPHCGDDEPATCPTPPAP